MSSAVTQADIENFKSNKRIQIDDYFKDQINTIDIKAMELTMKESTEGGEDEVDAMLHVKAASKKIVDELDRLRLFNLEQFEVNVDEIVAKFSQDKTLENGDAINALAFKKFCFLYNVDEVKSNGNETPDDAKELEAINKLKVKLIITDWYLNPKMLDDLK